jgi:hypothetical protein
MYRLYLPGLLVISYTGNGSFFFLDIFVFSLIWITQVFGSKLFCGGWTTTCWSSGEPRHMSMFGTLLKVLVLFERDTSSEA